MTDITKARHLFREAGLAFPTIPGDLAQKLKERDSWVFSTRPIRQWPYWLDRYVQEAQRKRIPDYALLSHSGHGANSYAVQYYLVHGPLHMFLHLGWGGVYMDKENAATQIHECFSRADEIAQATVQTAGAFKAGEHLTVVGSDFYGSYWLPPGAGRQPEEIDRRRSVRGTPVKTLAEVLDWLASISASQSQMSTINFTKQQKDREKKSMENLVTESTPNRSAQPSKVTKESVEQVLDEIDSRARPVPNNRRSSKYCFETRGRHYPPKYVLLRAYRIQGTERERSGYGGGSIVNNELRNLDPGYVIREDGCRNTCNFSD